MGKIKELEFVQKSLLRHIEGFENLIYGEKLQDLKLYSVEGRRERFCVIYIWKILNNLAPNFDSSSKVERVFNCDKSGLMCLIQRSVLQVT